MPPKKKGKKKKKDDAELALDENYKRTLDEIEALKDHLAKRKEVARRAKSAGMELKERMREADDLLKRQQDDQKSVSADMTRQYKTMQTEMNIKIHQLEKEKERLTIELENTQQVFASTVRAKDKEITEKDDKIKSLEKKIKDLSYDFDQLMQDSFSALLLKLEDSRKSWEEKSSLIQARNKQVLLEFHLNPLDL